MSAKKNSTQIWILTNKKAVFWNLIFLRANVRRKICFWKRHLFTVLRHLDLQFLFFQNLFLMNICLLMSFRWFGYDLNVDYWIGICFDFLDYFFFKFSKLKKNGQSFFLTNKKFVLMKKSEQSANYTVSFECQPCFIVFKFEVNLFFYS